MKLSTIEEFAELGEQYAAKLESLAGATVDDVRQWVKLAFVAGAKAGLDEAARIVSRPSFIVDDRDKYALNRAWDAITTARDAR